MGVCGQALIFPIFSIHWVALETCFLNLSYSIGQPHCRPLSWLVSLQGPNLALHTAGAGTSQYSTLTAQWLRYIRQKVNVLIVYGNRVQKRIVQIHFFLSTLTGSPCISNSLWPIEASQIVDKHNFKCFLTNYEGVILRQVFAMMQNYG